MCSGAIVRHRKTEYNIVACFFVHGMEVYGLTPRNVCIIISLGCYVVIVVPRKKSIKFQILGEQYFTICCAFNMGLAWGKSPKMASTSYSCTTSIMACSIGCLLVQCYAYNTNILNTMIREVWKSNFQRQSKWNFASSSSMACN